MMHALATGLTPGSILVPAAIPSPSFNQLGPIRMYALAIILGVFAGVWLARRRWEARGGDPEDMVDIAFWAVPAGLIGARLYHVITDWKTYFGSAPDGAWNPVGALEIWKGGLGIPGGIIAGVAVGVFVASRKGIRLGPGLDAVAPALPLAQAIGRLGNWFNQEVFGRPTDLPWGLQIDPQFRPREYATFATFHPTFLYEALWNLGLMAVLILIDRRRSLRPGRLFVLYVGGYGLGRLWVESLRSDNASLILGLRVNIWMSLLMIVGAAGFLFVAGLWRRPDDVDEPYRDGHRYARPDGEEADGGPVSHADEADPTADSDGRTLDTVEATPGGADAAPSAGAEAEPREGPPGDAPTDPAPSTQ